jgi:hypothetical protein
MPDTDKKETHEFAALTEVREDGGSVVVASMNQVLDRVTPTANPLVQHLARLADHLAGEADWSRDQFLEYAGCSSAELVIQEEVSDNFMLFCLSYLKWLESLLDGLNLALDRRATISGASGLFVDASGDLEACKEALAVRAPVQHSLSGAGLVRLGEIKLGFETALANLDTPEGRRVRRILIDDPEYADSPHLALERVELLESDPAALGHELAEGMRKHLEICPVCAETYRDEISLGNSPDLHLSR